MNILGTIYAVDEKHIDVAYNAMLTSPPPLGGLVQGSLLCMDMDETSNDLEEKFPAHCMKATVLCPPPIAVYKEIDGDQEGFIELYDQYLETDESVQDLILSMLLFLHVGGKILLYTPALLEDQAIWMNTLMIYFFTRYGIKIGTSATDQCEYDPRYDIVIANELFAKNYIDVFDYLNSTAFMTFPPMSLSSDMKYHMEDFYLRMQDKAYRELIPYCGPGESPQHLLEIMRSGFMYGTPVLKPAVSFD